MKIAIFGDLMLDTYLRGSVTRISPEAPVPILQYQNEEQRLGGAANVALNLLSLGINPLLCSLVGRDKEGSIVTELLKTNNICDNFVVYSEELSTIKKTRVVSGQQQLLRIDWEESPETFVSKSKTLVSSLSTTLSEFLREADALIISDYGKGMVNKFSFSQLSKHIREKNLYTAIDPKKANFDIYQNIDTMTPNHIEAADDVGMPCTTKAEITKAAPLILKKHNLKHLLITRGKNGMALFERDKFPFFIPTFARSVYDVSGAGDTVIACFTAAHAAGASFKDAAIIANHAAGLVVSKFGTESIDLKELVDSLKDVIEN